MEDLELLKKHSGYFRFDKKFFELLKAMSYEKLNTMNNNSIILAPLLEEICKYAMILSSFNDIELETIKNSFYNEYLFDELSEVINSSFNYISDAIDNGCCHPTILAFNSLLTGADLYDTMVESVYDNYDMFSPNNLSNLFQVDEYVNTTEDDTFNFFIEERENFKNIYELGFVLGQASIDRARNKMLMDDYNTYSTNLNGQNVQVKMSNGLTYDLYNDLLSETFRKNENSLNLEKIEKYYKLYKLYQYEYLKNKDKHVKLLKKCNLF